MKKEKPLQLQSLCPTFTLNTMYCSFFRRNNYCRGLRLHMHTHDFFSFFLIYKYNLIIRFVSYIHYNLINENKKKKTKEYL